MAKRDSSAEFAFDSEAAERAVSFFAECLTHTTGEWRGKPFILSDWQAEIVRNIFGWKRADGTRKYRTVFLGLPRKMGKTTLTVITTTAGFDRHSLCYELWDYAEKVSAKIIVDESFYPAIYAAAADDDWKDPKTWAKANPNFGVTVQESFYEQECAKAISLPGYENTFRRLYLNQWTEQDVRWLSMDAWDACAVPMPDLKGLPCFAGLDLSSTTDITALVLAFPIDGKVHLLPFFWVPADGIRKRADRDRVPYDQWHKQGLIQTTPGKVIDYEFIRAKINELAEIYHIKEVAIDRWNATQLSTQLTADGFEMIGFGQGFASMAAPTKELERRILEGTLNHGANPVLRWMASNVTTEQDAAGNIKPSKKKSTERIDGIVATIMALGRVMLTDDLTESTGEVFFV